MGRWGASGPERRACAAARTALRSEVRLWIIVVRGQDVERVASDSRAVNIVVPCVAMKAGHRRHRGRATDACQTRRKGVLGTARDTRPVGVLVLLWLLATDIDDYRGRK
jgi:hypothetical protein